MKFFKVLIPLALALLVLCAQLEAMPADSEMKQAKDKPIGDQKQKSLPFLLDDEAAETTVQPTTPDNPVASTDKPGATTDASQTPENPDIIGAEGETSGAAKSADYRFLLFAAIPMMIFKAVI